VVFRVILPVLAPEALLKNIRTWRFLDFNLYNFSLNYFALLLDSNSNRSTEGLSQGLSFTHFQRKNLRARQHGEGDILAQTFSHGHGNGCFSGTGLTTNQDGSTCDFALLDHFEDDACRSSGFNLF
jgi:hypothetical protein